MNESAIESNIFSSKMINVINDKTPVLLVLTSNSKFIQWRSMRNANKNIASAFIVVF